MDTSATTREFTLEFLEQITDNFSEERVIGRGGYGVVYKGVLENGEEIALKKLHRMPGLDDTQFRNEFNNLMRAQHPNVTRLVGYCYHQGHQCIKYKGEYVFAHVEERVLCFEYLQGGSLDKHISDESCGLDWSTRFKIIKGVCEGLNYLHNGCKDPIYHLDLKPANVLLDKNMFPKIGDFGLSRLFPSSQTYITNKNIGTPGYMPPEYIERRKITSKSDVFSLGVIIVRIIAGDEGYSKCADMSLDNFLEHVHGNWGKRLKETMASHTSEQVKTCIEIALRCMKVDREKRPTIAEIVDELNLVHTAESSTTGQVMASNRVKLSRSRPTIAEIVDELNLVHTAESSTTGQVMASNRVTLLYKGHQILNVIFGILIGLIAVLRWCKGRAEFDRTAIQTFLVNFSMIVFICVLPQSLIRRYFLSKKGRGVCFEAYIWTGAMVLHDYVALLMINIQYIRIVMIPGMILILIGTLGWKLRKSRTVEVGSSEKNHDRVNTMKMEDTNNEEILFVEKTNSSDKLELFEFVSSEKNHDGVNTMKMEDTNNEEILNSSDKLELFEFVSYLLQLSLVTWTQYKGQQGCTPVLSDFLLFFCSALGALGVMLASPLAGVNFRAVSEQVLPVLHKTCAVALFIAVHTLAAEWLREDMAYVCLPELITVLAWFTICFGESMSVSNFKSHRSKLIMVSSVVAILAGLISLNANDSNMQINLIMWSFRISLSSSAFSLFHVWLLHGWPGRSSESIRLIHLLNVASIVGSSTAAILCAYMIVTDPMIMYEAISSFEHKAIAAVVPIILLTQIVLSAPCRPGQPETQTHKILVTLGWEHLFCGELLHKPRIRDLVEALKRLLKQSYRNSGLLKPRSTKDAAAKAAFDAAAVAVAQAEAKQRQRQQQHHGR